MKPCPFTALALAAAVLASCSITKDAQRGISFEFQQLHQGRHNEAGERSAAATAKAGVPAQYQGQESVLETALAGEGMGLYLTTPELVDPTVGANDYLDGPKEELESMDQAALIQESESPSSVTPAFEAAMDEPSILKARIMWGIPVLLMFFGIGFLLNFGLHWYYLGKMRRARKSTYLWSLTLSASLVGTCPSMGTCFLGQSSHPNSCIFSESVFRGELSFFAVGSRGQQPLNNWPLALVFGRNRRTSARALLANTEVAGEVGVIPICLPFGPS